MSLQLIGTNQTNSTLMAYEGNNQYVSLYSAFGSVNNSQNGLLPGFNGERPDPFTGVSHLGNGYRGYNPILMRFTCPDSESPFGIGGINPYAYCENDPVNHTDPSGHGLIVDMLTIGLKSLFKYLFSEETSEAMANIIVRTTKGALTYGTQVAKNIVDIVGRVEEGSNPQAAAKLQTASFALGIINGITTLYSSATDIIEQTFRGRGNRGSIDVQRGLERGTRFGRGGREVFSSLGNSLESRFSTSNGKLGHVFEDIFNSLVGSGRREGSMFSSKSKTKIIYQLINSSSAIISTVFAIASRAVEEKNPAAAQKLSLVSSILGYFNLGMSFGSNAHEFYGDLKDQKNDFKIIGNKMSDHISNGLNKASSKIPSLSNSR
ncbi:RHS repeat-associated core domain-containing protein [Pseudescherichia sp.]|uniref:RHS repeat-associated core domain-containing protein n=1 Tax=Pseudescherichia sp. TaxID=2055881 RepID=UPI00289A9941|nr:RHS repeat-associated core domain-containing protein [Pseudescherichia sp.]